MTYECKFGALSGGMGFTENCTKVGQLMVNTDTLTLLHHILIFLKNRVVLDIVHHTLTFP
jgi:hypothetical protein